MGRMQGKKQRGGGGLCRALISRWECEPGELLSSHPGSYVPSVCSPSQPLCSFHFKNKRLCPPLSLQVSQVCCPFISPPPIPSGCVLPPPFTLPSCLHVSPAVSHKDFTQSGVISGTMLGCFVLATGRFMKQDFIRAAEEISIGLKPIFCVCNYLDRPQMGLI